ncbi:YceI family protein [Solimicrobium silvestre]|nr:YceI family protein [Solimicrobium silvestre]
MKKLLVLIAVLGISVTALAAPEIYVIDGSHTMPRFEYNHFGYSIQLSRFDSTTGKITLDRQAKSGSVEVEILSNSVDTGSAAFNHDIQSADFLDTGTYPTINYKSTKVSFSGDVPTSVEGNLTIKGITKPVTLTITSFHCMTHPMLKKDACGANATAKINRSDFNAGKYAPYVSDEMTLIFGVESIRQD